MSPCTRIDEHVPIHYRSISLPGGIRGTAVGAEEDQKEEGGTTDGTFYPPGACLGQRKVAKERGGLCPTVEHTKKFELILQRYFYSFIKTPLNLPLVRVKQAQNI